MGFPGPAHAIAERSLPMSVAMGVLAVGATRIGLVQIPKVDFLDRRLPAPDVRGSSKLYEPHTKNGLLWLGLVLGTLLGLAGDRDRIPRVGGASGHRRGGAGAHSPAV